MRLFFHLSQVISRAIDIEVAHTLCKDSCMICIRKFIVQRDVRLERYTDNGTSFIGVRGQERIAAI